MSPNDTLTLLLIISTCLMIIKQIFDLLERLKEWLDRAEE